MPAMARRSRVIWGIEGSGGIAATINRTPAQARWLIKNKKLRVKRHGPRTYSALEHELLEDVAGEFPKKEEEEAEPP
jgi:hypothetical protein